MAQDSGSVALVLSAFGDAAPPIGPVVSGFRRTFPTASVTLYTDADATVDGVEIRRVTPPFDRSDPRYADRASDHFRARGLLDSDADVAVAMAGDLRIVSDEFRTIVPITNRFGLAVPAGPRMLTAIDRTLAGDADDATGSDPSGGTGIAIGRSPWAFCTARAEARETLEAYLRILGARPAPGPAVLSAAAWETGFHPYVLPFSWCMEPSRELRVDHLDGHEIVLHVGAPGVAWEWRRRRAIRAMRQVGRAIAGKRGRS